MRPNSGAATAIFVAFALLIFLNRETSPPRPLPERRTVEPGPAPLRGSVPLSRQDTSRSPLFEGSPKSVSSPYRECPCSRPKSPMSLGTQRTIQFQVGLGAGFRGETIEHEGPGPRTDLAPQTRVARKGLDESGHRRGTVDKEPGLSVLDDFPMGDDVGDHGGNAGRHRLDDGVRGPFPGRAKDEDVRRGQVGGHVIPRHLADEMGPRPDVRIGRKEFSIVTVPVMFL